MIASAGSNDAVLPCLYCGDTTGPKTGEHVIQSGLGAGAQLHDEVCHECNTGVFSPLDGFLVRIVHDLFCRDHADVVRPRNPLRGHHVVHRDEENAVWLSVRLDDRMRVHSMDELIWVGAKDWHASLDPDVSGEPLERHQQMIEQLRQIRAEDRESYATVLAVRGADSPWLRGFTPRDQRR